MARPRKRKTNRNPISKVTRKPKHKMNISFSGVHPVIQSQWDKKLTLKQNYERMGLTSHLGGYAGGVDEDFKVVKNIQQINKVEWRDMNAMDTIETKDTVETIETLNALDNRVIRIGTKLNHKNDFETDSKFQPTELSTKIINEMVKDCKSVPVAQHQSEQETLVFEALISKYGNDYDKMARDFKLNSYQLSAGQIKRKIQKTLKINHL
jgi:nucleolar protein 16